MSEEINEYVTFTITTKTGDKVELAVVDEFEYSKKIYAVTSVIEGDVIKDDEIYIYRAQVSEDDFKIVKILDKTEYQNVCKAYMTMLEKQNNYHDVK